MRYQVWAAVVVSNPWAAETFFMEVVVPADLALFAVIVGLFFVVGLPMILKNVRVPSELEIEEIPHLDLSPDQIDFLVPWDNRLAAMGYMPRLNYRVANLQGANLVRGYFSTTEWPAISLNLLRSDVKPGMDQSVCFLEIASLFADGTLLSTRNVELDEVLEPPPFHIIQDYKGEDDPVRLKAHHDLRVRSLVQRGVTHLPPEELFDRLREHHSRWTEHQLNRGALRRDESSTMLRPTVRTALRGIRNFVNPLADNFTVARFVLALVAGLGVPCMGLVLLTGPLAPHVVRLSADTGLSAAVIEALSLGALLTVTGAVVGGLFTVKSFIWTFALAYIPLRLLGPAGLIPLWLSLWTGLIADWVARRRDRDRVPI